MAGFNRKYAIRILAIKHHEGKKLSGRTKTYSERSVRHLKRLWVIMGEMCSMKMVQALKTWLKYYEDPDCDDKVLSAIMDIQFKLPFPVLSFNTDNGTEFLNRNLYMNFSEHKLIEFTRSRPYKKNDNSHVEQKNWIHVRENLGYERYD